MDYYFYCPDCGTEFYDTKSEGALLNKVRSDTLGKNICFTCCKDCGGKIGYMKIDGKDLSMDVKVNLRAMVALHHDKIYS